MPKEGYDSRVLLVPENVSLKDATELKELSNAIATSLFNTGLRYTNLEVTLVNIVRLPI